MEQEDEKVRNRLERGEKGKGGDYENRKARKLGKGRKKGRERE